MINDKIRHLQECLKGELPGRKAQELMAPSIRPRGSALFDGSNPRSSGVMILLFPTEQGISTVFIVRTAGGPHGGQISLPGGKQEKSDRDLSKTALRETQEEIGVDPSSILEIGTLTPLYVPHSNFFIQPVIGFVEFHPTFIPDQKEVAGVIEIPLMQLFDPKNRKSMILSAAGAEITAPYYEASGHRIWGATAMIISEFERIFISCISG
ncbi:MAG: CoA pyrophosphatase [Bacteroidales bacterium]|jgi:8-oxo-dGTP pyrophosphatase MutT (NUDIX family)